MSWEQELREAYRTVDDLVKAGFVTEDESRAISTVSKQYQLLIPRYYANLIDRNNPRCPIRLQAIPSVCELNIEKKELSDPLQDMKFRPVDRITHRYKNRALFHLTSNCSMYCRFCFRKTLLNELKTDFFSGVGNEAFDYLEQTQEIEEVIFSGGDPFMMSDANLGKILSQLAEFPHIKRVRFHTRVPVTLPSRVTEELVRVLTSTRFKPVVVTHFNHPKEITELAVQGILKMKAEITLLNQSVLLKGVNDSAQVLVNLSQDLFEVGILPYYLHQLDPAKGTGHFEVSVEEGKRIMEEVKTRLPGYLVPRYVADIVTLPYKSFVTDI